MSTIAIIVIVVLALLLIMLLGGYLAVHRRGEEHEGDRLRHLTEADRALEQARAGDKGWDRGVLEAAATRAVEEARPGFAIERLELTLVDDPPGVEQDRAHFAAAGPDGQLHVVLTRSEAGWAAQSVE